MKSFPGRPLQNPLLPRLVRPLAHHQYQSHLRKTPTRRYLPHQRHESCGEGIIRDAVRFRLGASVANIFEAELEVGVLLSRDEGEECTSKYSVLEAAVVRDYRGAEHDERVEELMVLNQIISE